VLLLEILRFALCSMRYAPFATDYGRRTTDTIALQFDINAIRFYNLQPTS
jgi:hypothetical protein